MHAKSTPTVYAEEAHENQEPDVLGASLRPRSTFLTSAHRRSHKLKHNLYKSPNAFMQNPYTVCRGGVDTENVHITQQPVLQTESRFQDFFCRRSPKEETATHSTDSNTQYSEIVSELNDLRRRHSDYFNITHKEIAELNGTIQQQRSTVSEIRVRAATSNRENEEEIRSLQDQLSEFNKIKARSFRQECQIADFEKKFSACATLFHDQNEIIERLQRELNTPQEPSRI